jgi:uncharacterized membrane protein YsdA (DUF1294 family)
MVTRRTRKSSVHVSIAARRTRTRSSPLAFHGGPVLSLLLAVPLAVLYRLRQVSPTLTRYILIYHLFINIWTCVLYWHDKAQSRILGAWRVSEKRLHMCELVGGWPAALVSQRFFQHKTQKFDYQVIFRAIVFGHEMLWCWALWILWNGFSSRDPGVWKSPV